MRLSRKNLALVFMVSVAGCQVTKTQEGQLPEVEVKGGRLPKYEVKSDVRVRLDTTNVVVPRLERTDSLRR